MKKTVFTFVLTVLLFTGMTHAKITNKAFLMEIFTGCMGDGADYDALVGMMGIGGTFEYCGCATNEMSINMNIKDVMKVGIDVMAEYDESDEPGTANDRQLAVALRNKNLSNAIVECMSKVIK